MTLRLTILTVVYIAFGVFICVVCIGLMQWFFSEIQRASLIKTKWPYFILIPPIATFITMLLGYNEQVYSTFRAGTIGLQFRDDYGVLAYYIMGRPMFITVLLSIILSARYVIFKLPKVNFEYKPENDESEEMKTSPGEENTDPDMGKTGIVAGKGEIMGIDKDTSRDRYPDHVNQNKSVTEEILESNVLKGYFKTIERTIKNFFIKKVAESDRQVAQSTTEDKKAYLEDIQTDTKIKVAVVNDKKADHVLENVDRETKIQDFNYDIKIKEKVNELNKLKNPKSKMESFIERIEQQEQQKTKREEITNRESVNRNVIKSFSIAGEIEKIREKAKTKKDKIEKMYKNGLINKAQRDKDLEDIAEEEEYLIDALG